MYIPAGLTELDVKAIEETLDALCSSKDCNKEYLIATIIEIYDLSYSESADIVQQWEFNH